MTDKTKRIILIAAGILLCAALVVGIVSRLAAVPMPIDPAIPDDAPDTKDPVVNISDPEVKVDTKTDGERHDPGRDADSSGTEQTIQGTPTKPDAPEHPGKTEKDHAADDVPEADRNKETPPTYKPEQTEVKPQPTEPAGGSTRPAKRVGTSRWRVAVARYPSLWPEAMALLEICTDRSESVYSSSFPAYFM